MSQPNPEKTSEKPKLKLRQFARKRKSRIEKTVQQNPQPRKLQTTQRPTKTLRSSKMNPTTYPQVALTLNQSSVDNINARVQNEESSELEDDLNVLYTKIKSVPNYSAKLADFLRQNNVHSKHRRIVKKKFPRRRIIVHFPFQIFMGDLIEYQNNDFKHANGGYKFILVLIDVFSKKAYARPVKKKNKFDMAIAMESILSELDQFPNTLITDEGLEFYNKNVKEVLNKFAIHHYSIKSKMKASVVERFIRTLKSRYEKYFVKNKTKRWTDVLPQFIKNYNSTPHRSIGMSPNMVNDNNAADVFKHMYPGINLKVEPRLKIGDMVRKLKEKTIFDKGYKQSWSDEIYRIVKVKQAAGRVWYIISDLEGNLQSGIKYYWELNLVKKRTKI